MQATDYGRGTKALPVNAVLADEGEAPGKGERLAQVRRLGKRVKSALGFLVESGVHLRNWVQGVSVLSKEVIGRLQLPPGPMRIRTPEEEGESSLLLLEVPKGGQGLGH